MTRTAASLATGPFGQNWPSVAVKHLAVFQSGSAIDGEEIEDFGTYPVYGGNGLRGYTERFTHKGEFVLVGRQGALCGNINYAEGRFWASEHALVGHPRRMFDRQWFGEALRTANLGQFSTAAAQPGIAAEVVNNLRIPVPPVETQRVIARFLDRETGLIDGLIEKKTRFIALLKEKRAAVITHAVTKGIDPDAPMKDSGNTWIGMIPKHWAVSPLKFLLARSLQYGATESGDSFRPDWPRYIRITDITMSGKLREDEAKSLDPALARPYLVKQGDLLLARSGATVGKSFLYEGRDDDACFAGYMIRASADREKLLPAYLNFFFQSHTYWEFILGTQSQSTIQNVSAEKYAGLPVTVPSLLEQKEICARLQAETGKIDGLITLTERSIDLLREKRAALITAAVTGKIDVRAAA